MSYLTNLNRRYAKETAAAYHILVEWVPDHKRWELNFGDYDKSNVKDELNTINHIAQGTKKKNFKILTIADASNKAGFAALAKMQEDFPNGPMAKVKEVAKASYLTTLKKSLEIAAVNFASFDIGQLLDGWTRLKEAEFKDPSEVSESAKAIGQAFKANNKKAMIAILAEIQSEEDDIDFSKYFYDEAKKFHHSIK